MQTETPLQGFSIFDFQDIKSYLLFVRRYLLVRRHKPITLEKWASRLGYRSPRSIAMVLKGQRLPSEDMVLLIAKDLGLGDKEKQYLRLLVRLEKLKTKNADLSEIYTQIEEINPKTGKIPIEANAFAYIAQWQHLVLRQLLSLKRSHSNIPWMIWQLRNKLSEGELMKTLETLTNLGMLKKISSGWKLLDSGVITGTDVPSKAIQLHHSQMMERAQEALQEQDVLDREFTSVTLGFPPEKIKEAKEMIRHFRDNFDKKFRTKNTDQVYQLNIQFFAHTRKRGSK